MKLTKKEIARGLERLRWPTAVSYGEVSLPDKGVNPAESRSAVSLKTKFSQNIGLNQPIVSANMMDITESEMAIACAFLGGIGIVHRFCLIDYQGREVKKTKRAHNFLIPNPYSIQPRSPIGDARNMMSQHKVGSLLVKDNNGKLAGLLTQRDIRFVDERELVEDHMTPRRPGKERRGNLVVATHDETLDVRKVIERLKQHKVKKLPVVDIHNFVVGLISAKDIEHLQKYPLANLDRGGNLIVGAAIGTVGDYLERAQELKKAGADVLVLDVTSACSNVVEKAIPELRKKIGDHELVVGNIDSSYQAEFLINLGVQGIKIGVGPGHQCTTRLATGAGAPQLYTVIENYWNLQAQYGRKPEEIPPLCADGGVRYGKDVRHALLGGAHSVMIGTLFAGTKETPGQTYSESGKEMKRVRGMASLEALIARYQAEGVADPVGEALKKSPEGKDEKVEVKGSVENIINDLLGGVRSGISRRGVLTLEEAKVQCNPFDFRYGFVRLSEAGQRESYDRR